MSPMTGLLISASAATLSSPPIFRWLAGALKKLPL
jgi:hypothetical protein